MLEGLPDYEAHAISFSPWLTLFYCLQGARLAPIDIEASTDVVPAGRVFRDHLAEIESTTARIRLRHEVWKLAVPESSDERHLDAFLTLVRAASETHKAAEEDSIIARHIHSDKIAGFKASAHEGFNKGAWLRSLAAAFDALETRDEAATINRFGLKVLFPKEPFLEESRTIYIGFGDSQGRSVGRGAADRVLRQWFTAEGIATTHHSAQEVRPAIAAALETLKERGYQPSAIILRGHHELLRSLQAKDEFVFPMQTASPVAALQFFQGLFKDVPVFSQNTGEESRAIVRDIKAFGKWVDYQIAEEDPRHLAMSILELTEEEIPVILQANPTMLERQIRQRVGVTIEVLFDFEISDPHAAVLLDFEPQSG